MLLKRDWKSAADGIVLQNFDSEREPMEGNKSSSWSLALLRTCSEFSLPSGKQVVVNRIKTEALILCAFKAILNFTSESAFHEFLCFVLLLWCSRMLLSCTTVLLLTFSLRNLCVSVRSWITSNIRTNFYLIDKIQRKLCWNFILPIELSKVCQIWQLKEELYISVPCCSWYEKKIYICFLNIKLYKKQLLKNNNYLKKKKKTPKGRNHKFVFEVKKYNGKTLVRFHLQ